jgi:glutathione peroxidase
VTLKGIALITLDGKPTTLAELSDGATLVVNVASKCGLTPQYTALEKLAKDYSDRGLTVVGVPCNQFMGQEPGTADEIQEFCSTTYGVTFPLLEKTDVNGDDRHPLYTELTKAIDFDGQGGATSNGTSRNSSSRRTVRCSIGFGPGRNRTRPRSSAPSRPC